LVAEKYVSGNKKIKILEERIRELEENNDLLTEKNEFWRLLQLELTKQNDEKNNLCTNCWKSEEQEMTIMDEPKEFEKVKFNDDIKNTHKHKNKKNTNNIMTNTSTNNINNKKILILEWSSAELKDGTMRFENFKVVAGSEKETLLFYSTFFTGNFKFKKGEIYQLSTSGNFVEDASGTIPGSFDASGIIQGIDNGGYEFEKVAPALLIKELWEEKSENANELSLLETDLEKRKQEVNRVNQELTSKKIEFTNLQSSFNNLQSEKTKGDEKISSLEKDAQEKDNKIREKDRELSDFKKETTQLQNQLESLKKEKTKIENEWASPERKIQLLQEKESLSSQLKTERRSKQSLIESLENLQIQQLNETIQEKLERKRKDLNQLKVDASGRVEDNQRPLLETLLEKQEDFDLALFENVDQTSRTFVRAQEKLQEVKDKLIPKLGSEEVEEICKMQTEIGKLENSQRQWDKMEDQQQKEEQERFEVPPKN